MKGGASRPRLEVDLEPVDDWSIESDSILADCSVDARADVGVCDAPARDVEMVRSRLTGVALTGAEFERLAIVDCVLENCELSGALLVDCTLVRVQFHNCRMSGLQAGGLAARDVVMSGCRIDGSNFGLSKLTGVQFDECDLKESDFGGAQMEKVEMFDCRLDGSEVSNAKVLSLALNGSSIEGLRGASSLRNTTISSDQLLPLAAPILRSMKIVVDD